MRSLLALILVLAPAAAHAGRPLQADDAPVMAPSACELEGAYSQWRGGGQALRQSDLQLGCGIGWSTELNVQAVSPRELAVGGKTQAWSAPWRDGDAQLSIAWRLAHRHEGQAWRRSGAELVLVASLPLSPDWVMHANLGHQRDELLRHRSTGWALAVEHNGLGDAGRWQPMAEVFGDDHGRPWANAALRVAVLPERFFLDASVGRRLAAVGPRLLTLGFRQAF